MNTTTRPGPTPARTNLALGTLFLGAFVIGSAELVVVGILNLIAADLSVSISTAGTLVTAYALGISIGGPLLAALTIRFGRRFLLRLTLAGYLVGNLLAVVAVNFGIFLAARIITGTLHGLFIGVALAVATGIVTPDRIGRAISMVIGGIAVSTVFGVPLGTLVGQALGWQSAFIAIVVFGALALVLTLLFIPQVENTGGGGFGTQVRSALAPRVLVLLLVGLLLLGGQFTAFTYLAPYLEEVTGISGTNISVFLVAFGITNAIGTFIGGRFADRSAKGTLVVANIVLIGALALFYFAGSTPALVALALGFWGLVGFGLVPSLQHRVVTLSGPGRDFAAILPASTVNAGIALGAVFGGWAVASSGVEAAALLGAVVTAVALPITWASGLLNPPAEDAGAAAGEGEIEAAEQSTAR